MLKQTKKRRTGSLKKSCKCAFDLKVGFCKTCFNLVPINSTFKKIVDRVFSGALRVRCQYLPPRLPSLLVMDGISKICATEINKNF